MHNLGELINLLLLIHYCSLVNLLPRKIKWEKTAKMKTVIPNAQRRPYPILSQTLPENKMGHFPAHFMRLIYLWHQTSEDKVETENHRTILLREKKCMQNTSRPSNPQAGDHLLPDSLGPRDTLA